MTHWVLRPVDPVFSLGRRLFSVMQINLIQRGLCYREMYNASELNWPQNLMGFSGIQTKKKREFGSLIIIVLL